MRYWLFVIILAISQLAFSPLKGSPPDEIHFYPLVNYQYGDYLTISGRSLTPSQVTSAFIFFQDQNLLNNYSEPLIVDPSGEFIFKYDLFEHPIQAFSTIYYWFEIEFIDQTGWKSPRYQFVYEDNRFSWNTRLSEPFRAHWYEGDILYALTMLDVARESLQRIQSRLPLPSPEVVDIYAYPTSAKLREALQLSTTNWIGAHADPDLRVMLISVPEGTEQRYNFEQQIPHELMHILLYEKIGEGYNNLPMFLNEGLASNAEPYPNPDYFILLENAHQKSSLLPLISLCSEFPKEAAGAYLAYAQSAAFTQYLNTVYGTEKILKLIQASSDGQDCENAVLNTYGIELDELDRNWQQEKFGEIQVDRAVGNIIPWMGIFFIVLMVPLLTIVFLPKRANSKKGIGNG